MSKQHLFSLTKKDFEVQTFRSGGSGGQNQNKVSSGVRIIHKESGARGEARDSRDQLQNKKQAFQRLLKSPKFKLWMNKKVWEVEHEISLEEHVEKQMNPVNLKVEELQDGKWVECTNEIN